MIGVFLGFLISNWSASNRDEEKTSVVLNSIENEIQSNKSKIENVIDYHRTLRDSTRYYLNQQFVKPVRPTFFRGVNTVILNNSAFETAIQTGLVTNIPVDEIQRLNDIYGKQESYKQFSNMLLSGLITMGFDGNEKAMKRLLMYLSISMTDIVIKEEQLLESYTAALEL
ncbi:hypothetical protein LX97_02967 [Nonlabens dokdonensis]|uniref:Uncharacterized protein n=2 Tax=Nonlabens dokdonensis TaxID=328515 RepID=L7WH07_NONDD|nr:hypothetical protein [Nonlabens dokdonensis]AGC78238.1 hypothetical protein DDD_3111 [Nonlabens dokdonensis DSW-6]PZX37872.1 hypothetical protein LX97_02967 [Nonlabens dokdonensis]